MRQEETLDLSADDAFQRREWKAQRIGWIVWTLVVVAAFLGLLGPGWLSSTSRTAKDGTFSVAFDRFLHYHNPSRIDVTLNKLSPEEDFELSVANSLLDGLAILRIEPEPLSHRVGERGVTYAFKRDRDGNAAKVVFHVEYEEYWNAEGEVALVGSTPLVVKQFVFP